MGIQRRHEAMLTQAHDVMAQARYREEEARRLTSHIAGALAYALREQQFTDTAIGEALGVSRNRVSELVNIGIWPTVYGPAGLDGDFKQVANQIDDLYGPLARPNAGWVHTLTGTSGLVAHANAIPLPDLYQEEPSGLDTAAAQFDNINTGERILVYTLERHFGKAIVNAETQKLERDHKGWYRIELCTGGRQPIPLTNLGITEEDLRFGRGWKHPKQRRDEDDAYRNAIAAVRCHYGIWPLANATEGFRKD
ncbi:hypothetical protein FZI85_27455 [Mycobacterium sp. CBMA293]|uniref:Uncharacterized protein n=2 Tax=unclassified Mycolicibacterium TaxID=2636767 RepID=A0A1S6GKV4_9MYCO|nr:MULTISPECIES: hypothetical protein [unclassified Mycolicibacterium]AQS22430.1 hypothetical protein pCBMA213_2_00066 [Mycolicibacterium sp. CBMA 213]MUL50139.1 hypothetical protein [Mycolicibacterium sp. CBMA 360]MUL62344.1 hypothetical protein [Mycolicibacterium sp. CBMA 335]MUM04481.1 hypothetical protein [Mycolicibacterium sp. CBMA 213]MUM14744.1 hypothetical protein [Mycolicibacterium sp. CBMA 293]